MDPICHTMFGAALASTGLERKTRFGRATLILGANLPDVDVLSSAWGEAASEFSHLIEEQSPTIGQREESPVGLPGAGKCHSFVSE